MFVLDSHCDTPTEILNSRDLSLDNKTGHVDFPKLMRGGVDGAFFALYVPASMSEEESYAYAHKMLTGVNDMIAANPDKAILTTTSAQAYANKSKGLFSVFLGLENASPLGHSLDRIHEFHAAGVRYTTLCHSGDNAVCDSCAGKGKWGGLSQFGREVVAEMNKVGMLIDVSHVSDRTFYDVIEVSSKPVVATHSCCRALADHPRNMTDDMIRTLAAAGGVLQVNFYPVFLSPDPSPSYRVIADHIDHIVSLVGIDHVGIGSDFDGIEITPVGMDDISGMPLLFEELRHRGYSEADLSKIASGNFFRVLNESSCSGA